MVILYNGDSDGAVMVRMGIIMIMKIMARVVMVIVLGFVLVIVMMGLQVMVIFMMVIVELLVPKV